MTRVQQQPETQIRKPRHMKTLADRSSETKDQRVERPPTLSPSELRALYFLREKHIDELIYAAIDLDEGQRRLALRLVKAMADHRRSMLS
jgi:hypothetical protein